MADNFIGFKVSPEKKYKWQKIAEKYKTTLTDYIIMSIDFNVSKEKVCVKLDKDMRKRVRERMQKKMTKEIKAEMRELYTIKNCMTRIWDICHADYCLHRRINIGKVDVIRKLAKRFYNLCSPKNKKLMKADMEAMMLLTKDSIIQGLESRRLMLKSKAVKNELPYTEKREDEIEKTITL